MPEGDSLVRVADRLRPVLAGQRLLRTDFRIPQLATADLSGATVGAVWPRAKYLVIEAGERAVLSHLKMEGRWDVYDRIGPDGAVVRPRWGSPGWQARCVLETAGHQVVGFQLGLLEILDLAAVPDRLAFLGPDLLDPAWQDPVAAEALLAESLNRLRQDPDRPIGLALLDQRLVSGIGNVYRCEVLLLARLHPHRPVGAVPDLPGLLLLSQSLLRANTGPGPRTTTGVVPDDAAPYGIGVRAQAVHPAPGGRAANGSASGGITARGVRGRVPRYWVYGRERQGCLRCRGPVVVEQFGDPASNSPERVLFWCPNCQR